MVEWKKLGELGSFENIGTDKKIVEGEKLVTLLNYVDVYHHKYIDSSIPQMQVSASDTKIEKCTVEQGDIFVTPSSETVDDIGHSSVITETISNAVYSYHIMRYRLFEKNMLLSYFINYVFDTDNVKKQILKKAQGLTRFGLSKDKFASIIIPVPSLSEQSRIVSILDTFTDSIDNLKQQIEQRRKQYEHYRDQLLDLEGKEGVEMIALGDVCKPITPPKKINTIDYLDKGLYPIIDQGQKSIVGYTNDEKSLVPAREYVLFGDHTRIVKYFKGQFAQGADGLKILVPIYNIISRFLYFALSSIEVPSRGYSRHWSIAKEIPIPVPSLEEQSRIVSILDTFEASIANLEEQLKLREKQYEYYRNKLLTFE